MTKSCIRSTLSIFLKTKRYETLERASGKSGLALARGYRSDQDLTTRQIVMITANPALITQRTAMNLGADDYLTQPFTADQICNVPKHA